jgi:hypothetical protein
MKKENLDKFHFGDYENYDLIESVVKNYLIGLGNQQQVISYTGLCENLNLPFNLKLSYHRKILGYTLGNISKKEVEKGGVPISALIIDKTNCIPGNGFYILMEELGYDVPNKDDKKGRREFFGVWLSKTWKYLQNRKKERERKENKLDAIE